MPDRSPGPAGSRPAPAVTGPASIRNVALVGHSGAGKTTLVEAMLVATGTVARAGRVEDGTTVTDFDEAEVRQHRSVSLALAPVEQDGVKINLLDTPGYPDFVADLRAGLRAADAALFVVSAVDGVDAATHMLWEECAGAGTPRAVVVTRLDHPRADFAETVAVCRRVFGEGVAPLYLPMADDSGTIGGLVGLLSQRVFDYSDSSRAERDTEPEHRDLIAADRATLIEGIIAESEDETLMDRYLAGEDIELEVLTADLEKAVARGSFYPVLACAAPLGIGVLEVLEVLRSGFPSPLEHPVPVVTTVDGLPRGPFAADPDGPLVAEVVKTTTDPYVGRISLVRVFSGTLRPDATVHVSGHLAGHAEHDSTERVGAVSSPLGRTARPIERGVAGDVVAVARLAHAETGDTLSDPGEPLLMQAWSMPDPLLPLAITATSKNDEDKLASALARLVAEDPTLRLEMNPETHQLVLWTMGEAHTDVLLDRLRARYGVAVRTAPVRVALRETFAGTGRGHGRHVKQSGGHGQFAIVDLEVEPLPNGTGVQFVDKVVGGAVPRQFIPSVEKGVRAQVERGVLAGYPMVDVRVTLVDGKSHPVDSSDMAFQTAGALAVKEAASAAGVALLEPVDEVVILVADEYLGGVMSDLSARRGRVQGSEPAGGGRTVVRADVPELEMTRYPVDLRALSQGTGSFTRRYVRHEPLPAHLAATVTAAD